MTDTEELRAEARYDTVLALDREDVLRPLWSEIHDAVVALARDAVPSSPEEDAWHGPASALLGAAWIVATRTCLPAAAGSQWTLAYERSWYSEGHWRASTTGTGATPRSTVVSLEEATSG